MALVLVPDIYALGERIQPRIDRHQVTPPLRVLPARFPALGTASAVGADNISVLRDVRPLRRASPARRAASPAGREQAVLLPLLTLHVPHETDDGGNGKDADDANGNSNRCPRRQSTVRGCCELGLIRPRRCGSDSLNDTANSHRLDSGSSRERYAIVALDNSQYVL